jgi:hypothetical protein
MACEIAALKDELEEKPKVSSKDQKNLEILSNLFEKGIIDSEGNLLDNSS